MKQFDLLKRSKPLSLHSDKGIFYLLDLKLIQKHEVLQAIKLLDKASLDRSQQYVYEEHQHKSIITHALLRFHLAQLLDCLPLQIEIKLNPVGKPFIEGLPIHFNLSHTKAYAFIGFHSELSIGVDIEKRRDYDNFIKSSILHDKERNYILNSKDPLDTFYQFWCAKEALLKALGTGFKTNEIPLLEKLPVKNSEEVILHGNGHHIYVFTNKLKEHTLAICYNN